MLKNQRVIVFFLQKGVWHGRNLLATHELVAWPTQNHLPSGQNWKPPSGEKSGNMKAPHPRNHEKFCRDETTNLTGTYDCTFLYHHTWWCLNDPWDYKLDVFHCFPLENSFISQNQICSPQVFYWQIDWSSTAASHIAHVHNRLLDQYPPCGDAIWRYAWISLLSRDCFGLSLFKHSYIPYIPYMYPSFHLSFERNHSFQMCPWSSHSLPPIVVDKYPLSFVNSSCWLV